MILIDSREQKHEYITNRFNEHGGTPSTVICLSHGMDYLIMGEACSVGIQRKSGESEIPKQMSDLKHDILPALKDLTENPVLLIEEDFAIGQNGTIYRHENNMLVPSDLNIKSYFNFIHSVKAMGIDVVCTRNLDASIWWMISTHQYVQNHHYPKVKKSHKPSMQAVGSLCAINTIGQNKATKLLQEFTLQEIFTMPETELKKHLTENQLYNFIRAREANYVP